MNGWIKLYRSIWDNPIVTKDIDHLGVWIYLLTHASHEETDVIFHGKRITLKPGELSTSQNTIATKLGISREKVKRILNAFKSDQQIDQRTDRQNTVISILAWDRYQQSDQRNDQRVTNERPTSDQQNKNIRIKELKNNNTLAQIDERFNTFWKAYPKKVGKGAAEKAFIKINPSEELLTKMLDTIEKSKQTEQWKKEKGQFIPYPATWLNQGRWDDEITVKKNIWEIV